MRIAHIEIAGKTYPAALSLQVFRDLEDRYHKPGFEALGALIETFEIGDVIWLLAEMLRAGADVTGEDVTPPTEAQLLRTLALDDVHKLAADVMASVNTVKPLLEPAPTKKPMAKLRRALRTRFG